MTNGSKSITSLVARRDAARFSGRERELQLIERALLRDHGPSVIFVHGPGGVGKSTLLREAIRRAERAGYRVERIDGRDADAGAASGGGIDAAAGRIAAAGRALLVIDTFERIAALEHHLRGSVLGALPAAARVLIASRTAPSAGWSQDGWDAVTVELQLGPVGDAEAAGLLAARGIDAPHAVEAITRWADGLPLALAVAADAFQAGETLPPASPLPGPEEPRLAATLLRRLAGDELEGADRDVLAVTAIAAAVDARLLSAVLPAVDSDHAEAWLRGLSFAERRGTRVTLHERVRGALRRELAQHDPEHERRLRQRIADHLHSRAALGEPWLVVELAALIDDPLVRWGFSLSTDRFHVDKLRPGDAQACAAALDVQRGEPWWDGVQRFLDDAPDCAATVRDATGHLAGLCVAVTPELAPPWASEDAVLGPWLTHASARWRSDEVLLWRDAFDLVAGRFAPGESPVTALLNTAASTLCSPQALRCFYGRVDPDDPVAVELSRAIGATRVPELDVTDGPRRLECHVLDHGADGLVGTARRLVYRDLGLPAPTPTDPAPAVDVAAVRDALRGFHDPLVLAASPLARGTTVTERAAAVRALLREAVEQTFGERDDERLQRAVLQRGYLDDDGGHARAALELHLSRTTYFRRLAAAAGRVAEFIVAERAG